MLRMGVSRRNIWDLQFYSLQQVSWGRVLTLSRSEGRACPPGPLCGCLGTRVLCCSF